MNIRSVRFLVALASVAVLTVACGSEAPPREPGTFEGLLRFVPDSPQYSGSVRIIDFKALRDMLGVKAPGPDADDEQVLKYKQMLAYGDPEARVRRPIIFGDDWLSGFRRDYITVTASTRPYLGFDSRDVDQVLYTNDGLDIPLRGFEVVVGGIRAGVAIDLLAACDECVPHEIASYAGREFFTWGRDAAPSLSDRLAAPAHDQFGRGGRILIEDGYAIRALYTEAIQAAIDAVSGNAAVISDDEAYVLAVRAMDEAGVISMTVTRQPFSTNDVIEVFGGRGRLTSEGLDPEWRSGGTAIRDGVIQPDDANEAIVTRLFQLTTPPPAFEAVSTGIGSDEDGLFAVIALVFSDRKRAESGADAIKDRLENGALPVFSFTGEEDELTAWTETITSFDVRVSDRTALVRLRPIEPRNIERFVLQGYAGEGIGFGSNALFLVAHE